MTWMTQDRQREALVARLPGIAAAFNDFYSVLWSQPHLPAPVLELCRLRLAQLHNSECELLRIEVEISGSQRESLSRWNNSDVYSDAEKACLEFTEIYAMDCQAITDAQAEAVKTHFGDAGLVALIEALGILDGMTRLSRVWDLPGQGT
jgi:alkylhydroperoxidase family enzyme